MKVDAAEFEKEQKAKLAAIDPTLRFKLTRDSRKDLDKNLQGLHALSLMGGMVSMVETLAVTSSPNLPSPRVAARVSRPSSYSRSIANPSTFSSHR